MRDLPSVEVEEVVEEPSPAPPDAVAALPPTTRPADQEALVVVIVVVAPGTVAAGPLDQLVELAAVQPDAAATGQWSTSTPWRSLLASRTSQTGHCMGALLDRGPPGVQLDGRARRGLAATEVARAPAAERGVLTGRRQGYSPRLPGHAIR
jgi:hypothetical protein